MSCPVTGHTEGRRAEPAGVGLLSRVDQTVPDHVGLHVGGLPAHHTPPQLTTILINYLLHLEHSHLVSCLRWTCGHLHTTRLVTSQLTRTTIYFRKKHFYNHGRAFVFHVSICYWDL